MSAQIPDLSRRKLLRSASYASLALLGGAACAHDKPKMAAVIDHHAHDCDHGKDCQKKKKCKDKPVDTEHLMAVSTVLWTKFHAGANPMTLEEGVFEKAFKLTGPFVICRLDEFPADGDHLDTSNCSTLCGQYAREEATKNGHTKITKDDFECAWCRVQKEMQQKLARAVAMSTSTTTTTAGGDDTIQGGMGCA